MFTDGTAQLDHAGETGLIHGPLVPYSCTAHTPLTGFFCLFTADFLHRAGLRRPGAGVGAAAARGTPRHGPHRGAKHLFEQLLAEAGSTYRQAELD